MSQPAPAAWVLRTEVDLDELNVHLAALEAAGLTGVVEEDGRAAAYFPQRVDDLPVPGRWEPVPERDWHAEWRARVQPLRIGRVIIAPPWARTPPAGDEVEVVIEPGLAFGTGSHETTAGCLAALQEHELEGRSVLDVGAGSGVLAVAAAKLGADPVHACDTDPAAVHATVQAAAANDVAVTTTLGSLTDLPRDARFDVVVANLDTATVTALAPALVARIATGGLLIVSGVSIERGESAVQALTAAGVRCERRTGREWLVLVCADEVGPGT